VHRRRRSPDRLPDHPHPLTRTACRTL
jgi:hypothetical protein